MRKYDHIKNDDYAAVMKKYKGKCGYCGAKNTHGIDHFLPLSRGGTNNLDNLVLCCFECNLIAGCKVFETVEEKRIYILARRVSGDVPARTAMNSRLFQFSISKSDAASKLRRALLR